MKHMTAKPNQNSPYAFAGHFTRPLCQPASLLLPFVHLHGGQIHIHFVSFSATADVGVQK